MFTFKIAWFENRQKKTTKKYSVKYSVKYKCHIIILKSLIYIESIVVTLSGTQQSSSAY